MSADTKTSRRLAHNVFFTLQDNSAAARQRLLDGCQKHLAHHAGIVFFACGVLAEDMRREVNDRAFDVGLHIVFADQAAHDIYQDMPGASSIHCRKPEQLEERSCLRFVGRVIEPTTPNESHLMSHGTEHHLEEAHHAEHAAQDNFTRNVAMTMAIVAASLACVTLLSHRSHNATIQNQIKSNDNLTEAANRWAYYQAKKNRQYMLEANAEMLAVLPRDAGKSDAPERADKLIAKWEKNVAKYKEESVEIEKEARELTEAAKKYEEDGHLTHLKSNFFDFGELGIELALVLCSVAVLTKRSPFWLTGITVGTAGFAIALCAFVPPIVHLFEH